MRETVQGFMTLQTCVKLSIKVLCSSYAKSMYVPEKRMKTIV